MKKRPRSTMDSIRVSEAPDSSSILDEAATFFHTFSSFILFLAFFLSLFFGNQKSYSQTFEADILQAIQANSSPFLDQTMHWTSESAAPVALLLPASTLAISYLKKDKDLRKQALFWGEGVVINTILVTALKKGLKRERPFDTYPSIHKWGSGGSYSMPSGHTSNAFSIATTVSISYPKWYVIAPAYVWASSVAFSRMYLGAHYPSDILAGALLGAGSAFISYKLNHWLWESSKSRKRKYQ